MSLEHVPLSEISQTSVNDLEYAASWRRELDEG